MVGLSCNHPLTGFFAFAAPAPNKGGGVIPSTPAGNSVGDSPTVGGAWLCRFFQLPQRTDNLNHDLGSDFDGIFLRNLKKVGGVVGNARQKHKQLVLPQRHAALGRWQYRAFAQEE